MTALKDTFTSTGHKFFWHQEAMKNLRDGKGQPVVTHVMLTDVCNHTCAFCSVQHRAGDSLAFCDVMAYLDTLMRFGLKAVILSGGGNPILYKCKQTGKNFNDVVDAIHGRGLEIGLITNGMPLKLHLVDGGDHLGWATHRHSWAAVHPRTLDKLTWVRISMSGLDHEEDEVYVPHIDPGKTTLGFSYVFHDIYDEPADKKHGKVSRPADLITLGPARPQKVRHAMARVGELTGRFIEYVTRHHPRYLRLLPNCLEPSLIPERCEVLAEMAASVNREAGYDCAFVQHKPPKAPNVCLLGVIHPVLNSDGFVYPCDSCVLNETAGHAFANPWRVCRWDEVASLYGRPIHSLIADPKKTCPGCVFTQSNLILEGVVNGTADITPPTEAPEHAAFV
jgi:hypothetical protein